MQILRLTLRFKMKVFSTMVGYVMVLMACSLVGCFGEPMRKPPVLCEDDIIHCPCGKTGKLVTSPLEMCPSKSNDIGQVCVPCFRPSLRCFHYNNCKTCQDGVFGCTSCPRGKTGKYCNINRYFTRKESVRYTKAKIPRDVTLKRRRLVRQSEEMCTLPDRMETNEIQCTIRPSSKTCVQRCVYGHEFPEGKKRTIHCDFDKGVWEPTPKLEECDSIINCHIVLSLGGAIACTSHMMDEKTRCKIKCNAYDEYKATNMSVYECHGHERWTPSLPFCVEVKVFSTTVTDASVTLNGTETIMP